jgi:hypothetical protein
MLLKIFLIYMIIIIAMLFMSIGRDCASELPPPTGLLFIPQMIYEYGEPRWNNIDRDNRRTRRKTCPIASLSTTKPIWNDPGSNPGLRFERPSTRHRPVTVYFIL